MFFAEWRKARGLSQEQLAARLGTTKSAVSKLETGATRFNQSSLEAWADALSCEPADFYHHPDRPTASDLLRGQPEAVQEQAIAILKALVRR